MNEVPGPALAPAHQQAPDAPAARTKQSTERGEGRAKLTAALTKHHHYADGCCLNFTPVGNNKLASLAGVDKSTASAFFTKQFGGHAKYRAMCRDSARLIAALKLLNGEYPPRSLYDRRPAEEGRVDE